MRSVRKAHRHPPIVPVLPFLAPACEQMFESVKRLTPVRYSRELAGALAEHLVRLREPDAASLLRRRTDKIGAKHPRYLRVNTLRITVDEAIKELLLLGYRLVGRLVELHCEAS